MPMPDLVPILPEAVAGVGGAVTALMGVWFRGRARMVRASSGAKRTESEAWQAIFDSNQRLTAMLEAQLRSHASETEAFRARYENCEAQHQQARARITHLEAALEDLQGQVRDMARTVGEYRRREVITQPTAVAPETTGDVPEGERHG